MTTFLAKRLFALLITLLVASLIIFLLLEILPGDPASIILGVGAQEDTLAALRTETVSYTHLTLPTILLV